ncbi:MAG TPA: patatin-like phospholipase family protein, partial [Candidatus Hodarchaeales archaeon]|nr:patatin-like phospholipase family protein [Candidatus Hodarchaeales archaeon]
LFKGENWKKFTNPISPQGYKQRRLLKRILGELKSRKGIYEGKILFNYIDDLLKKKASEVGDEYGQITFGSLLLQKDRLLKIVASDIAGCRPRVFDPDQHPQETIANAIRASVSIPLFFQPPPRDQLLTDGGLISNFPAWVFDSDRVANPMIPTVGFRLRQKKKNPPQSADFKQYLELLAEAALTGADFLQFRGIRKFIPIEIELRREISSFNFLISKDDRKGLADDGYASAQKIIKGFKQKGILTPTVLADLQKEKIEAILGTIRNELFSGLVHARASIMLPTSSETRKVIYTYNYDETDQDTDLELAMNAGCSGHAWSRRIPVLADLVEAKKAFHLWGLDHQQQAKVRPGL